MQCNAITVTGIKYKKLPDTFETGSRVESGRPLHNRYIAATMAEPNQGIITFLPDAKVPTLPV